MGCGKGDTKNSQLAVTVTTLREIAKPGFWEVCRLAFVKTKD